MFDDVLTEPVPEKFRALLTGAWSAPDVRGSCGIPSEAPASAPGSHEPRPPRSSVYARPLLTFA